VHGISSNPRDRYEKYVSKRADFIEVEFERYTPYKFDDYECYIDKSRPEMPERYRTTLKSTKVVRIPCKNFYRLWIDHVEASAHDDILKLISNYDERQELAKNQELVRKTVDKLERHGIKITNTGHENTRVVFAGKTLEKLLKLLVLLDEE
jgi:hypothetical protein